MSDNAAPAWFPDPMGRHELRWWDGTQWTDNVSDGGQTSVEGAAPQPPSPPSAPVAPDPPHVYQQPVTNHAQLQPEQPSPHQVPGYPQPVAPAAPGLSFSMSPPIWVALGGAVAMLVSLIFPWATNNLDDSPNAFDKDLPWLLSGGSIDDNGFFQEGDFADGWVLLLFALALGAVVIVQATGQSDLSIAIIGIASVALLFVLVTMFRFFDQFDRANQASEFLGLDLGVTVGAGMYVYLLGTAAGVVGGVLALQEKRLS